SPHSNTWCAATGRARRNREDRDRGGTIQNRTSERRCRATPKSTTCLPGKSARISASIPPNRRPEPLRFVKVRGAANQTRMPPRPYDVATAALSLDQAHHQQDDYRADQGVDDGGDDAAADEYAEPRQQPTGN